MGYDSSISILKNHHLEHLGLSSLAQIQTRGHAVQISLNPQLCYTDSINWRSLLKFRGPRHERHRRNGDQLYIFENRPAEECGKPIILVLGVQITWLTDMMFLF